MKNKMGDISSKTSRIDELEEKCRELESTLKKERSNFKVELEKIAI